MMEAYATSRYFGIFFIGFVCVNIYLLQNLILAVIFNQVRPVPTTRPVTACKYLADLRCERTLLSTAQLNPLRRSRSRGAV